MTAPMTDLLALKARVDAATGPDQLKIMDDVCGALFSSSFTGPVDKLTYDDLRLHELLAARAWTDAALALIGRVLPGWELLVTNEGDDPGTWVASIGPRHTFTSYEGVGPTPALALVSALLAALIAQEQDQ